VVWPFLLLGIAAVVTAFFIPLPKRELPVGPVTSADPPHHPDAPVFVLTERSGREVASDELDGKVWIASFVFTRCTQGCPAVTTTVARLQKELNLAGRDDLRLVTFTVDPERDQLADLKKYADNYRADAAKWLFLTGPEKLVRLLLNKGFKIAAKKRNVPKPGDEFDHSTKLLVIDKRGQVRGWFDGMVGEHDEGGKEYEAGLVELKKLVDELAKEPIKE
jgi:cytochrome oxidase Cu insertion factor (SCO1/SenC/PrrC family)